MTYSERALDRIYNISWGEPDRQARFSDTYLLKEYLARAWEVASISGERIVSPIFNPLNSFDVESESVESKYSEMKLRLKKLNSYELGFCFFYFAWRFLLDEKHPIPLKHPDVFEPLIVLFERGGRFIHDKGDILIGNYCISLKGWSSELPGRNIDNISLSLLDKTPAV